MVPGDIAARHPRLYHLTDPAALPGILQHGLLPASGLMDLFEISGAERIRIGQRRRPQDVQIAHPVHGRAVINDNAPLNEAQLARCLQDGLTPADWLAMLNGRVFFWPNEASLAVHRDARSNRGRPRLVLVLDTLSLLGAHGGQAELAAINTGSTIRTAARRGLSTFTPIGQCSLDGWRGLRGRRDVIREVTIVGGVADVAAHLADSYLV